MINKGKLFDAVSIVSICGTILIVVSVILFKIYNEDNLKTFTEEVGVIYDLTIKQNKKDRVDGYSLNQYSYYKSRVITNNKDSLDYVAEFDETTKELDYLCVTNGDLKIILEGKIDDTVIEKAQIINSKIGCEFRNE